VLIAPVASFTERNMEWRQIVIGDSVHLFDNSGLIVLRPHFLGTVLVALSLYTMNLNGIGVFFVLCDLPSLMGD